MSSHYIVLAKSKNLYIFADPISNGDRQVLLTSGAALSENQNTFQPMSTIKKGCAHYLKFFRRNAYSQTQQRTGKSKVDKYRLSLQMSTILVAVQAVVSALVYHCKMVASLTTQWPNQLNSVVFMTDYYLVSAGRKCRVETDSTNTSIGSKWQTFHRQLEKLCSEQAMSLS